MKSIRERALELQVGLGTKDAFALKTLCDETLQLIEEVEDENMQMELRKMVLFQLIDLNRLDDARSCIASLMSHRDYHSQLAATLAKSKLCQISNDEAGIVECFDRGIEIAERNHDGEAIAEGYLLRGKALFQLGRFDDALEDLNRAIPAADDEKNYKLIAVCKYYIGMILLSMGHEELGLEKIREASEMAHEQRAADIIMHTEMVRALYLLKEGKDQAAEKLLDGWFNEFKMML